MKLGDITGVQLNELSTEFLGKYKKAAAADAHKADDERDYKRGDKRFGGIIKATKKQFSNTERDYRRKLAPNAKESVDEAVARPVTDNDMNAVADVVKQCMVNATINMAPYNSAEFRLQQIQKSIRLLSHLEASLGAVVAIDKASTKR